MGACCGGMRTGEQKSLPEGQKVNNVDESDKCVNGPKGDAKETPAATAKQSSPELEAHANANHTEDHVQPSAASPDQVELKITEPNRLVAEAAAAVVCPVAEKPDVCPELPPPAPDTQPTPDEIKPATEVTTTTTTTTTTTQVEHTQLSSTTETTEVRTTTVVDETPVSTDAASKDEEQPKVSDVELVKPGDDVASAPVEVTSDSVTAGVDLSAETTAGAEDHQKQVDSIVEASAGEVVQAASVVDQQEPAAAPSPAEHAEQVREEVAPSHETAVPADTAPAPSEQPQQQEEQLPTATAPEVSDAPTATAYVESGTVDEAKHEETPVEAGEQPEQQQQQLPAAATDDVAAATEQIVNADVGEPSAAVEAPADMPSEVTAVAHEEPSPASEEVAAQPKDVEETPTLNTEGTPASESAEPVVDDSVPKPEEATTAQDAFGDVHPEELPPPLTPEKEDPATAAAAACDEEDRQAPATDGYVEPTTDETLSQQPDIDASIDNVEEPTSKSNTEPADNVADVPVADEP